MKSKVDFKINRKEIKRIQQAGEKSIGKTAEKIIAKAKEEQLIPKETGRLEESFKVSRGTIVSDVPYAKKCYVSPYPFKRDKNKNAQSHWFDPWINGERNAEIKKEFQDNLRKELEK